MNIQDVFYLFGIIYMIAGIILMIVIGVVLLSIKNKITDLHKLLDEKMTFINKFREDPQEMAFSMGAKMANAAIKKVKEAIEKK